MKGSVLLEQIGNYKILRKLGEGGMGTVFIGQDLSSGAEVAIKLVKTDMASVESILSRFKREIQISKQFAHPFVIKILDGGLLSEHNIMYLVMELLSGESMGDSCGKARLESKDAWKIMAHMAEALSYIHERGIIHRDIKPDNILIVSSERTVLLDFGLALAEDLTRLSRTSDRAGTWVTMSPEQLVGDSVDGRSDIYSFGVTMYWALTGKGPYTSDEIVQIAIGNAPPIPSAPHSLVDSVDPVLSNIVMKCMSVSLEERFQSADELLLSLKAREILVSSDSVITEAVTDSVELSGSESAAGSVRGSSSARTESSVRGASSPRTASSIRGSSSAGETGSVRASRSSMRSKRKSSEGQKPVSGASNSFAADSSGWDSESLGRFKKIRRTVATGVFLVSVLIGGMLILRSISGVGGRGNSSAGGENSASSNLSDNVRLLNSMTTKILQAKAMADDDDLFAYGNLLISVLSKNKLQTENMSDEEEKQVNEVAALYYLYLSGLERGVNSKACQFMELIVERYGFTPLLDDLVIPINLIEKSKAESLEKFPILSFKQGAMSTISLLISPLPDSAAYDRIFAFLSRKSETAANKEEKHLALLALAKAHGRRYFIPESDGKKSPEALKKTVERCLEICRQLSSDNFSPENFELLASVYLRALRKPYTVENRINGIKFIKQWEHRKDISPRARVALFKHGAKMIDTSIGLNSSSKADQLLSLQYRKQALETGKKMGHEELSFLVLELADSYCDLGKKEAADELIQGLLQDRPDYRRNVRFMLTYCEILTDSMRPTEAIAILQSMLKEDETNGFLNEAERHRISTRIETDLQREAFMNLKNAMGRK